MSYHYRDQVRRERQAARRERERDDRQIDMLFHTDAVSRMYEQAHKLRHPGVSVEVVYKAGWYVVQCAGAVSHFREKDLTQQARFMDAERHAQELGDAD